jgi:transglutaminase-like putative cysteine protease
VQTAEEVVEILPAPDQYIRKLPDGTYQVLVSRIVENVQQGFVASDLELSDDDLKPSALVDFRDPLVKRMAEASVSGEDLADIDVALDLARTVKQLIGVNNFSHGLTKASVVAQDGQGDCSGRSVLLAALLRAQQIPSRVAAGLVYLRGQPARMVYHMWTLAYVDGRWMAFDATTGKPAPADRITLVTTNLSGGDEYKSLSPIINVLGKIEIQILRAQY